MVATAWLSRWQPLSLSLLAERLLVPQRLDGIELSGFHCGVNAKHYAYHDRDDERQRDRPPDEQRFNVANLFGQSGHLLGEKINQPACAAARQVVDR